MAVKKTFASSTMQIEIESGTDSKGNVTYKKKSFSNIRSDASVESIFAVAEAIKALVDADTRNVLVTEASKLLSE